MPIQILITLQEMCAEYFLLLSAFLVEKRKSVEIVFAPDLSATVPACRVHHRLFPSTLLQVFPPVLRTINNFPERFFHNRQSEARLNRDDGEFCPFFSMLYVTRE
jgi:hypothetical protein